MTLHLALSFIKIIPALCCNGEGEHEGFFEMQQEIKDCSFDHINIHLTEGQNMTVKHGYEV